MPDAGTIHVGDQLVSSRDNVVSPDQRGMGMVFQNYAVWPHKTVYENVVFGLKIRKTPTAEAKKKVDETLGLVNLRGYENRYPNELSGGQRQTISLVMASLGEPRLLLLDEHTAALDPRAEATVMALTDRLVARLGTTALMVTHSLEQALRHGDRLLMLQEGRLIGDWSAAERQQFSPASLRELYGNATVQADPPSLG